MNQYIHLSYCVYYSSDLNSNHIYRRSEFNTIYRKFIINTLPENYMMKRGCRKQKLFLDTLLNISLLSYTLTMNNIIPRVCCKHKIDLDGCE
jgi:hypothetical protein